MNRNTETPSAEDTFSAALLEFRSLLNYSRHRAFTISGNSMDLLLQTGREPAPQRIGHTTQLLRGPGDAISCKCLRAARTVTQLFHQHYIPYRALPGHCEPQRSNTLNLHPYKPTFEISGAFNLLGPKPSI